MGLDNRMHHHPMVDGLGSNDSCMRSVQVFVVDSTSIRIVHNLMPNVLLLHTGNMRRSVYFFE